MTTLTRHANTAIVILRGGAVALLFGLCFALGYIVGYLARVILWCVSAVIAGARAGWIV